MCVCSVLLLLKLFVCMHDCAPLVHFVYLVHRKTRRGCGIPQDCKLPCGRWESNLSPLKELLTTKPPLQTQHLPSFCAPIQVFHEGVCQISFCLLRTPVLLGPHGYYTHSLFFQHLKGLYSLSYRINRLLILGSGVFKSHQQPTAHPNTDWEVTSCLWTHGNRHTA